MRPWSGFVPKARHGALGCEWVGLTVAAGSWGGVWPGKGGPTTKATPVDREHSPRQWSSWAGVSGTFHVRKGSLGPDPHLPDFCSEGTRGKALQTEPHLPWSRAQYGRVRDDSIRCGEILRWCYCIEDTAGTGGAR